jgi:hypothetical protein
MSEKIFIHLDGDSDIEDSGKQELDAEKQTALDQAYRFLQREVPILGKLTGLNANFRVGNGWATDLRTGNFTLDPRFFVEKLGYSAEHSVYATLHELMAHVRDAIREPDFAARQIQFAKKERGNAIFNNILADIHGNKLMHNLLPDMENVAAELYANKLFPETDPNGRPVDYSKKPLHIQFLYRMIREEMIPGSHTHTRPEVTQAIHELRNFNGEEGQDVIKYLTDPASKLSGDKRFDQQLMVIYPVYQRLLEQAKQEKQDQPDQQQQGEEGDGEGEPQESDDPFGESGGGDDSMDQNDDDQQQDQGEDDGQGGEESDDENGDGKSGKSDENGDDPFAEDYDDYFDNKHPEPMTDEEHDKFEEAVRDAAKKAASERYKQFDPQRYLDEQIKRETGFSMKEHDKYRAEVLANRSAITRMRDVWRSVINERIALKRRLSKRTYSEGDTLDPNRLAQTIIDIKSGIENPEAYNRVEKQLGQIESYGGTDYFFLIDNSGSMSGKKAEMAAQNTLVMIEGLAAAERDILAAQKDTGLDLELSIRTACYTFGAPKNQMDSKDIGVHCYKPLSPNLTDTERLSTYQAIKKVGGTTPTAENLAILEAMTDEADRRKVVVIVTDGSPDNKEVTMDRVHNLRNRGWHVFAVGIGSNAVEQVYAPDAKYIRSVEELPDVLGNFIETTVNS